MQTRMNEWTTISAPIMRPLFTKRCRPMTSKKCKPIYGLPRFNPKSYLSRVHGFATSTSQDIGPVQVGPTAITSSRLLRFQVQHATIAMADTQLPAPCNYYELATTTSLQLLRACNYYEPATITSLQLLRACNYYELATITSLHTHSATDMANTSDRIQHATITSLQLLRTCNYHKHVICTGLEM